MLIWIKIKTFVRHQNRNFLSSSLETQHYVQLYKHKTNFLSTNAKQTSALKVQNKLPFYKRKTNSSSNTTQTSSQSTAVNSVKLRPSSPLEKFPLKTNKMVTGCLKLRR